MADEPSKAEMDKLRAAYEKKSDAQKRNLQEQAYVKDGKGDRTIRLTITGLGPSRQPAERRRLGIPTRAGRGRPAGVKNGEGAAAKAAAERAAPAKTTAKRTTAKTASPPAKRTTRGTAKKAAAARKAS